MTGEFSYKDYVTDEQFLAGYNEYQRRYAEQIRESDKVILAVVGEFLAARKTKGEALQLLDIGCSTGNLLLHLRHRFPDLSLTGGDLAESSLAACRADPALSGIEFRKLDLLELPPHAFDIVTVNAVLYMMGAPEFTAALASLAQSLRQGGLLLAFDFAHTFEQELAFIERSKTHPSGLALHLRSQALIRNELTAAGFTRVAFRPFEIPIDLPQPADPSELTTFTVRTSNGRRLQFRGILYQPWCHISAVKG